MSLIVSTPQQINMHPVNNSTSKFLFSFSKAQRFGDPKRIQYNFYSKLRLTINRNHKIAYDLPTTISTRAASLGYGTRYNFSKGSNWFFGLRIKAPHLLLVNITWSLSLILILLRKLTALVLLEKPIAKCILKNSLPWIKLSLDQANIPFNQLWERPKNTQWDPRQQILVPFYPGLIL